LDLFLGFFAFFVALGASSVAFASAFARSSSAILASSAAFASASAYRL